MHAAVRPYLATGVALVGVASIAVMPLQPSNPPIPVPALPAISSQAFTLTAQTNPIALWADVFNDAIANAGVLGEDLLSDPAPIIRQLLRNQIGYLGTAVGAGKQIVDGAVQYLTPSNPLSLPAGIEKAIGELKSGLIADAFITLSGTLITTPIMMVLGLPLAGSGLLDVPVKMAQNFANVVATALSLTTALPLLTSALGPVVGAVDSFGESVQDVVRALASGRLVEAITAAINIPAQLTSAVLNGYTDVAGSFYPGLLSFSDDPLSGGLVQTLLVSIPRAIAQAFGAAPVVEPAGAAARDAVAALPAASAQVVTLSVAADENPAVADEVDESTSGAVPGAADPVEVQAPVAVPDPEPAAEVAGADIADDISAPESTDEVTEHSEPKADGTASADPGALDVEAEDTEVAEAEDTEVADATITPALRGAKSAKDGVRSAAGPRTAKRMSARG